MTLTQSHSVAPASLELCLSPPSPRPPPRPPPLPPPPPFYLRTGSKACATTSSIKHSILMNNIYEIQIFLWFHQVLLNIGSKYFIIIHAIVSYRKISFSNTWVLESIEGSRTAECKVPLLDKPSYCPKVNRFNSHTHTHSDYLNLAFKLYSPPTSQTVSKKARSIVWTVSLILITMALKRKCDCHYPDL